MVIKRYYDSKGAMESGPGLSQEIERESEIVKKFYSVCESRPILELDCLGKWSYF